MPVLTSILIAGGVFLLLVLIQVIVRTKKPLQRAVGGICIGLAAFLVVNISGFFTGVSLTPSVLNIGISAAAGIPGVTMLLLLNLLFK